MVFIRLAYFSFFCMVNIIFCAFFLYNPNFGLDRADVRHCCQHKARKGIVFCFFGSHSKISQGDALSNFLQFIGERPKKSRSRERLKRFTEQFFTLNSF